jgi:hypothetical protein
VSDVESQRPPVTASYISPRTRRAAGSFFGGYISPRSILVKRRPRRGTGCSAINTSSRPTSNEVVSGLCHHRRSGPQSEIGERVKLRLTEEA